MGGGVGYRYRITPEKWTASGEKPYDCYGVDESHGSVELLWCNGVDCDKKLTGLEVEFPFFPIITLRMNGELVLYADDSGQLAGNAWSIEVGGVVAVFYNTVPDMVDAVVQYPHSVIVDTLKSLKPFDATFQILDPI